MKNSDYAFLFAVLCLIPCLGALFVWRVQVPNFLEAIGYFTIAYGFLLCCITGIYWLYCVDQEKEKAKPQ